MIGTGRVRYEEVTLTVDDTPAHAAGDVLAATQEIENFFDPLHSTVKLISLTLLDPDDQGEACDIVFLRSDYELGTENAAVDITDAEAQDIAGVVEIVAGDYVDLVGSQIAIPQFNPIVLAAKTVATRSLFVGAISRGTGTYAGAALHLRLGFEKVG